ncbi:hypothetical protein VNO77_03786 [Canavalia gladiata]|uniref:Uncharacterized protein n=1 Tax=Canavalia gladiata TaxID=3824 RepID=A0AAN9MVC9_CANGL
MGLMTKGDDPSRARSHRWRSSQVLVRLVMEIGSVVTGLTWFKRKGIRNLDESYLVPDTSFRHDNYGWTRTAG